MTPELEQLRAVIAAHKNQIKTLQEQVAIMIAACPHEIVDNDGAAVCLACEGQFGWYCPDSPDHTCYYTSEPSPDNPDKRVVRLSNGTLIKLPASHKHLHESDDWCIFCGQPDERK